MLLTLMSRRPRCLKTSSRAVDPNPATSMNTFWVTCAVRKLWRCVRSVRLAFGTRHLGQGHSPLKPRINAITHLWVKWVNQWTMQAWVKNALLLIICRKDQNDRPKPANDIISTFMIIPRLRMLDRGLQQFKKCCMPNNLFMIDKACLPCFTWVFFNLAQNQTGFIWNNTRKILTIGNQPTTCPPPTPSPFRISIGIFAIRAMTGYPFSVPKDDSLVLSAYKMKQSGWAPVGRRDCCYT